MTLTPRPTRLACPRHRWFRAPLLEQVATGCSLVIALATIPLALGGQRYAAAAKAWAWTSLAPACPAVSSQAHLTLGAPLSDVFDFGGARFARAYGYARCGMITGDRVLGLHMDPVCQFNNPTALEITTARGRFFFTTGIRPATILLTQGQPRCVLGAKLDFDWLRE